MKPVLLDLFCGAGGCTKGYQRAGFRVIGVDLHPQPRYCGEEFYTGDALEVLTGLLNGGWLANQFRWAQEDRVLRLDEFAAIHASPPCQAYSMLRKTRPDLKYPDLVDPVRDLLKKTARPYVIENVPGAPLRAATMLCGSMFGLGVGGRQLRRHRLFESNVFIRRPDCRHVGESVGVYGHGGAVSRYVVENGRKRYLARRGGYQATYAEAPIAMDIDWMRHPELVEAIPPAFTEYIGGVLLSRP